MKAARTGFAVVALLLGVSAAAMLGQSDDAAPADASRLDASQLDASQQRAAKTFAGKAKVVPGVVAAGPRAGLSPLSARERVVQLLDRFTFGARPGEVDRVLAMGADKWVAQQLNPASVADDVYAKRVKVYATLGMSPSEALTVYPDGTHIDLMTTGKNPLPSDPELRAMTEVLVAKQKKRYEREKEQAAKPALSDAEQAKQQAAERAAQTAADKEAALRITAELYALPRGERMAAFLKMPVEDRMALADSGTLNPDQQKLIFGDVTPREGEMFKGMAMANNTAYMIVEELSQGRMLRDVLSERQIQAVMTDFWFNHFNVNVLKDTGNWYGPTYERDVIAKNALGNFRDLLLATAESPAMMVYLDNWMSIGPDSISNGINPINPKSKRGIKGLNENYGREVMELHTVGVNGGYTQADVTALAAILTGWGVDNPGNGGGFLFDPKRHEPGSKIWMGYLIDDHGNVTKLPAGAKPDAVTFGPGSPDWTTGITVPADAMKQGVAALTILAESPKTAHFISYLLAQYFVADKPPAGLVDRLQKVYMDSHGDIKTILRALIASPEFNSRQYYRNKVKTPEEYVASAFRATGTDPQNPVSMENTVKAMGMQLYGAVPPTGYYLTADQWMNSAALVDRLNFAYALTNGRYPNQKFDAPKLLAMGLLTPSTAIAAAAKSTSGTEVTTRVLEATIIGVPVSAKTNLLIETQVKKEPAGASSADTLNLLTALVMGAPEFQVR